MDNEFIGVPKEWLDKLRSADGNTAIELIESLQSGHLETRAKPSVGDAPKGADIAKALTDRLLFVAHTPERITRVQLMSGNWPDDEKNQGGLCREAVERTLRETLDDLINASPTPVGDGWVKCSDWTPDEDGIFVDVWIKSLSNPEYGRRQTDVLYAGELFRVDFQVQEYVSHWCALPTPPIEGEQS
jgi:hypothetical protein